MIVPLLDLKLQYAALRQEMRSALERVIDTQQFILGPEVEALEHELAAFCGVRHAVGVSSGTDALLVALMACGVGPGDEVVTSPFSFFATAGVITRLGARPVFADIDPASFNMAPAAAVAAFTTRTRAVIPVHLYGRCAELDPVLAAAKPRGIVVLEDAAQAIGAVDDAGRQAGTTGEAGCLSFFPTKNLGAFGDAGMVITNQAQFAATVTLLRVHGMRPRYYHEVVGGNFRLDALQAAVLRVKLPHLRGWSAARRNNARRYRELFAEYGPGNDRVRLPQDTPGHIYNQFVIRTPQRDALRAFLTEKGIGTEIYYPVPLHLQQCFVELGHAPGDFPEAEAAAREVLALPIYPELSEEAQVYVVQSIGAFFERTAAAHAAVAVSAARPGQRA
jgi:dTDP-4-amino-4,6-dideoxygalactose transaminase